MEIRERPRADLEFEGEIPDAVERLCQLRRVIEHDRGVAAIYAPLALLRPTGVWLALILGALQFGIELLIMRHYALALTLITPLVLLLTGAATGELGSMAIAAERVIDTIVGAVLGMVTGLLHPRPASGVSRAG